MGDNSDKEVRREDTSERWEVVAPKPRSQEAQRAKRELFIFARSVEEAGESGVVACK